MQRADSAAPLLRRTELHSAKACKQLTVRTSCSSEQVGVVDRGGVSVHVLLLSVCLCVCMHGCGMRGSSTSSRNSSTRSQQVSAADGERC